MLSIERWPTGVASRAVALRWLGDVAGAAERLEAGGDREALHDFRVGIRRLRVTLKAYRPWLEDTVPPKRRKKLRRIGRASGASRDLEVQRAWLETRSLRSEAEAAARAHLLGQMEDMAPTEGGLEQLLRRFRKQERLLCAELDHARIRPLGSECPPRLFGPTTAGVAAGYLEDLSAALAGIEGHEDDSAIHAARIKTKRLRYLLEPFRSLPVCESACECLGALQNIIGDLRDVSLLARRIGPARGEARGEQLIAGYVLLTWRITRARLELFATLRRGWLRPGALDGTAAAIRYLAGGHVAAEGPDTT